MSNEQLTWAILAATGILLGIFFVGGVIGYRRMRRRDAHLAQHGTTVVARIVDAHPRHVHVNNDRGWVVVVAWTNPHTGVEHRFESDLVFASGNLDYATTRQRILAAAELPVRLDLAKPGQFHAVDSSALSGVRLTSPKSDR